MYNVLLVDDEPRTSEALAKNVNWMKYGIKKIFKAINMDEAIEIVEREKIEIMICDIEMPGGNGIQLLEWFREKNREINCIFLTCHPEFDYMRQAIRLRCYDYILKPVRYDEFEHVLFELIKKMEANDNGMEVTMPAQKKAEVEADVYHVGSVQDRRDVEIEVKRYVRAHLAENINVNEIGEALHFNPKYLMRAFKGKTGLSIVEFITNERMEMAKKLLRETNLSIQEVSSRVGYVDYAYFTRVFKKVLNMSPSHYRRIHK